MTGFKLKEIRKKMKLTQTEFAKLMNCHWTWVGRMERGEYPVSRTIELELKQLKKK